jgi:hypothetical protein
VRIGKLEEQVLYAEIGGTARVLAGLFLLSFLVMCTIWRLKIHNMRLTLPDPHPWALT